MSREASTSRQIRCTCGEVFTDEDGKLHAENIADLVHCFDGTPCHYEPPTLSDIVDALRTIYDDKGCVIWLQAPQFPTYRGGGVTTRDRALSALQCVTQDRSSEVMDKIDQLASGSFS